MRNFIVRDIQLFVDWNFDGYVINGKELTSRDDQALILADIEKLKPVTISQDGTVTGVDGSRSVDIATDALRYTGSEFDELWSQYGYPEQAVCE